MTELRAALFLDRDGVINEDIGYAHGDMPIQLVPGIADVFAYLQEYPIFVPCIVSNQSGITRGIYTEDDFWWYTNRLVQVLADKSKYTGQVPIAHSPDYDTESTTLKPNPGMLISLAEQHNLVLRESYIIGDHLSDLIAGKEAGCRGLIHRFQGSNVFDLFKCIPEVKFAITSREREQRRTIN
jgi:D-glycero-D-manno-heptose 1,7-bisphosphate phosphatase